MLIDRMGIASPARRALITAALWLVGVGLALPVTADEAVHRLTEAGARLGTLFTDGKIDNLRLTVALDGDVPEATHVWAVVGGSQLRQRTNEGYWIDWNGTIEGLIDNRFPVENDTVVFKVMDENIGVDNMGVTISIGYRAGGVLKYGLFGLLPEGSGQ